MKLSSLLITITYFAVNRKVVKGAKLGRALNFDNNQKENGNNHTLNQLDEWQDVKNEIKVTVPNERNIREKKTAKMKIITKGTLKSNLSFDLVQDSNSVVGKKNSIPIRDTIPRKTGELDCSALFDGSFEDIFEVDMPSFLDNEEMKFIHKNVEDEMDSFARKDFRIGTKTPKDAKRTKFNGKTKEYWYGELAGDDDIITGTMNIIKNNEDGSVVGSVTTSSMVYRINTDAEGKVNVIGTLQKDYPNEEDVPNIENGKGFDRALVTASRNSVTTVGSKGGEHEAVRRLDSSTFVDVLVVYTKEAMCSEANNGVYSSSCTINVGPIERLIELAVQETNTAYANSGINTRLNLVHKYMDRDYVEVNASGTHLSDLRQTNDGKLDKVHSTRDLYGADLVHMIVATGGAGIGHLKSSETTAFSVSNIYAATGYFTFGHEIGHNFGCWHDRGNSAAEIDYGHGYQDPQRSFRSIMAYNCPNGGCPRVQHFSNPNKYYQSKPTGTNTENCARLINDRASTVANFRQRIKEKEKEKECNDSPQGWHDSDGSQYDCAWYASVDSYCGAYGNSHRNLGKTANEACCDCGGGCTDAPNWHDADGPQYDCAWYASKGSYCSTYGNMGENFGKTASEACCVCREGN